MATVSVSTDLSGAYSGGYGTVTDASVITNWIEPVGMGSVSGEDYADMKSIQTESDVYIEGSGSISGAYTSNAPDRGAIIYNSTITVPTNGAILVWMWWIAPPALDTYSVADLSGIESKVDIIDSNVDDIKTTTNSIDDKVDTINTNVSSVESKINIIDSNVDLTLLQAQITRKILSNKAVVAPNRLSVTIYDDDITPLYTYDISSDKLQRTPV